MTSKNELLGMLERCLQAEKRAVSLYARLTEGEMPFYGFEPGEQARIRELLLLFKAEAGSHLETYCHLISTVGAAKNHDL